MRNTVLWTVAVHNGEYRLKCCRLSGAPFADAVAGDNCFPFRRPQLCSCDLSPPSPLADSLLHSQPNPSASAKSLILENGLKINVFLPLYKPLPTPSPPNSSPPTCTCCSFCTLQQTAIIWRAMMRHIKSVSGKYMACHFAQPSIYSHLWKFAR